MSQRPRSAGQRFLIDRRDVLKFAGAALASSLPWAPSAGSAQAAPGRTSKRVIVAGGGIGGLCCAFELMERGHDVTLLEASGRTGGHVKTINDPLPDNLYADVGAEHFNRPGYDQYWKYVKKFELPYLAYPRRNIMLRRIDGIWYTEEQLQDRAVLNKFGFNQREVDFIVKNGWTELPQLYFGRYLDKIEDEYQPFGVGLDAMDEMTASELLIKDGASDAGLRFNGLRRGDGTPAERTGEVSALYRIWLQSIMKLRGLPNFQRTCFRLQGGNQRMTDAFAARLGERVRLGCPIKAIEHGDSGVTVQFEEFGQSRKLEADYLVSSIPIAILAKIPVTPHWPEWKDYTLKNVVFGSQSRVVLQSRTHFWKEDLPSINLETGESAMYLVYQTADEVPTERSILMGSGKPDVTPDEALATFKRVYPGKSHTLEAAYVQNWSKDPWALSCERLPYRLGTLKKFWPHMIEPVGRIHFAGCHADNVPWGMDASTRSANRVAQAIDDAS
jgi:monoamine oxidase